MAAFDIGSNAVRMAMAQWNPHTNQPVIYHYSRVPLRLGAYSFKNGKFSDYIIGQMVKLFVGFAHLMERGKLNDTGELPLVPIGTQTILML